MEKILSAGILHFAKNGDFLSVLQLIKKNPTDININEKSTEGRTVISYVAEKGDLNIANTLLKFKANSYLYDKIGMTPLMYSSKNGNTEITRVILSDSNGMKSIDLQDNYGYTALMHAASLGRRRDVELLLNNNANKELKNKDNLTAMDVARVNGWIFLSEYIKKHDKKSSFNNIKIFIRKR
ncbi:MAG: ankyrin repeat domain-containing protein [Candidatus Micrarchaeaceae archaeon]